MIAKSRDFEIFSFSKEKSKEHFGIHKTNDSYCHFQAKANVSEISMPNMINMNRVKSKLNDLQRQTCYHSLHRNEYNL